MTRIPNVKKIAIAWHWKRIMGKKSCIIVDSIIREKIVEKGFFLVMILQLIFFSNWGKGGYFRHLKCGAKIPLYGRTAIEGNKGKGSSGI